VYPIRCPRPSGPADAQTSARGSTRAGAPSIRRIRISRAVLRVIGRREFFATKSGLRSASRASNLADSDGITEGRPRSALLLSPIFNAPYANYRPVLPRTVVASVTYRF